MGGGQLGLGTCWERLERWPGVWGGFVGWRCGMVLGGLVGWVVLGAVGCCWVLLGAVGCCWVLLVDGAWW